MSWLSELQREVRPCPKCGCFSIESCMNFFGDMVIKCAGCKRKVSRKVFTPQDARKLINDFNEDGENDNQAQ